MNQPAHIRHRLLDSLHSQPAHSAAQGAFAVIDALQHLGSPSAQVIALACASRNICAVLGLDLLEMQRIVERMEQDCRYRHVNTLNAVREYARGELLKHFP